MTLCAVMLVTLGGKGPRGNELRQNMIAGFLSALKLACQVRVHGFFQNMALRLRCCTMAVFLFGIHAGRHVINRLGDGDRIRRRTDQMWRADSWRPCSCPTMACPPRCSRR
jgi:hypothetical protein